MIGKPDGVLQNLNDEPYLSAYNQEILNRQPISNMSALQTLVDEVNASVTAMQAVQAGRR